MPESNVTENLLTDVGLGKIASLMKWLIACIISFALIASSAAIKVSSDITRLSIQVESNQDRLGRLERQQDSP